MPVLTIKNKGTACIAIPTQAIVFMIIRINNCCSNISIIVPYYFHPSVALKIQFSISGPSLYGEYL